MSPLDEIDTEVVPSSAAVARRVGRIHKDRPPVLTILAKRTYSMDGDRFTAADEPEPIVEEAVYVKQEATGFKVLKRAPEDAPDRDGCDLVVLATARAASPVQRRAVTLGLPDGTERRLAVTGDRHVILAGEGFAFSDPDPWEEMPLDWDRAYGGIDFGIRAEADWPREDILRAAELPPGSYPRNDVGKGFALAGSEMPLEQRLLPNVEDPADLLTSQRLVCPGMNCWHLQPRPAGFGLMDSHWFPRSLHYGVVAGRWPDLGAGVLPEEELGILPQGLLVHQRDNLEEVILSPGFYNLAAPGLTLPGLAGTERLMLRGLESDTSELLLDLPGGTPGVSIAAGNQTVQLSSRLFQVLLDLDKGVLTMLWGAQTPLEQPMMASLKPEDLEDLPVTVS